VQQAIEEAVAGFCGEWARVQCAGRTDAGVHATQQVAHLDLSRDWRPDTVRDAINARLRPEPIAIRHAAIATADFDARRSAVARHYRYRILNRRAPPTLDRHRVWHVARPLDEAAMQAGAAHLLGRHDFTTFRAAGCQASSPLRTLDRLDVERIGEEIEVRASARSFLHHQVRAMVGTLERVGSGEWAPAEVAAALAARERARCGPTAPAAGLCLVGVDY
jgi:tRNA pseudouridine38-40 synthase